jgi:hypothetical protein
VPGPHLRLRTRSWPFSSDFLTKTLSVVFSPPLPSPLIPLIPIIFCKESRYEFPHCAVLSSPVLFHIYLSQISSSTPCSQILPVYVPPFVSEIGFHFTQNDRKNYGKRKLPLCLINWLPRHEDVSENEGIGPLCFTSVINAGEWSASRSGRFNPKDRDQESIG